MGWLSDIEKTVSDVADRPLLPGLFKASKSKGDDKKKPPKKDGKK